MNKSFNLTQDKKIGLSTIVTIITVVLALIAGSVGGYYWQKQKNENKNTGKNTNISSIADPTADWKTYSNDKYGYSIKYPSNIQLEEPDRSGAAASDSQQGINLKIDNDSSVNGSTVSVSTWNKDAVDTYDSKELADFGYQKITIDGHKALKGRDYGNAYFIETYIYSDNYTYEVRYAGIENTANIDTYNQILSTFKFTK